MNGDLATDYTVGKWLLALRSDLAAWRTAPKEPPAPLSKQIRDVLAVCAAASLLSVATGRAFGEILPSLIGLTVGVVMSRLIPRVKKKQDGETSGD